MSAGEFLDAAASYLGLDRDVVRKSEVFSDGADMVVAFELRLSLKDIAAISERMLKMADDAQVVQSGWGPVQAEIPSYEDIVRSGDAGVRMVTSHDEAEVERARQVCNFGAAWDALVPDQHAIYKSRYAYLLYRARQADAQVGGVTSNADDFGGMPG